MGPFSDKSKFTLPGLLLRNFQKIPDEIALREKEFGIWREITWNQYLVNVKYLALGLISLGVEKNDSIAYITDNRPEWVYTELAAQSVGATSLGIYPDIENLDEIEYILKAANVKYVFAENQEQVDKVMALKSRLSELKKIVVDDFHELRGYDDPLLISFKSVQDLGRELNEKDCNLFNDKINGIGAEDVAMLSTTSGTSRLPKICMITHRNLIRMAEGLDARDPLDNKSNLVSFLPPAWMGERGYSLAWALLKGVKVNFPERTETVLRDLREISPTLIVSAPRAWEKMVSDVQIMHEDASLFKKLVYKFFLPIGLKYVRLKAQSKSVPYLLKMGYLCGDVFLYRKIRDFLGLSKTKRAYTGGDALGSDMIEFFLSLGVKMKQVYGQTEMTCVTAMHNDNDIRPDTVGVPLEGVEIKIADDGEVLLRGDSQFKGYYNDPIATEGCIRDGWFRSGDYGYFNKESHLVIVDRMTDVMKLNTGTGFSPKYLENKLKFSPYIREAVVQGHERDYIGALIQIEYDTVGKWAEDNMISYTTFRDLSQNDRVRKLIELEVERANQRIPEAMRIRRFLLFPKELDPEDGEITQTQKLRRKALATKFEEEIESLYN